MVLTARPEGADFIEEVRTSVPVLLKVLAYDLNFDARGEGDFVVLVVGEPAQSAKREQVLAGLKAMSSQKVKNRPLKFAAVDFKDEASLQAELEHTHAAALLVVPGTSAPVVKHVWEVAQDSQTYALALEAAMVDLALPIGVQVTGGKTMILINEQGAKSVGAKFDAAVLKLARIVQPAAP
jgi:hypothetical protein